MAKIKQSVAIGQQNITKYYWWGFGITLAVVVAIGLGVLIFGGSKNSDMPSQFDESELPQLPEESAGVNVPPLLDSTPAEQRQTTSPTENIGAVSGSVPSEFVRTWKVYSQRLFYDEGGGGTALSASSGTATTQTLSLKSDGSWTYGDSSGKWSVSAITDVDWTAWKINSYGPSRKITLDGWNKASASGPVEEDAGTVNFVWALYRTGPPTTSKPGTVQIKFGH